MILVSGHLCLDIISHVLSFPIEDSTVGSKTEHNRCTKQIWARGGNASNNATVLSYLGQPTELFATLANDHLLRFFTEDLEKTGIKYDKCPIIEGTVKAPASVVLCSEETGSRTIVHCKGDLPELSLHDFETKINLEDYSWVHFEGRNETEVVKMMQMIHEYNRQHPKKTGQNNKSISNYENVQVPISVEIEKCRETLHDLIPLAHVVFIGKDFAGWKGAKDCRDAVKLMLPKVSEGTVIICPWGGDGAAFGVCGNLDGRKIGDCDNGISKIDAVPPTQLIDSLGAGDTFVASTILCLNKGMSVESSVRIGCRLASEKLSMIGFLGLKEKVGLISLEG